MKPTDTDTLNQAESFLVESGLLADWLIDGFTRRLKKVATANGLGLGDVRQRSRGCLEFKLWFPRARLPSRNFKLRASLHELFRRTGYHVPGRALWCRVGTRKRNVVTVYAAPQWQD